MDAVPRPAPRAPGGHLTAEQCVALAEVAIAAARRRTDATSGGLLLAAETLLRCPGGARVEALADDSAWRAFLVPEEVRDLV
jgi:hypothetical protein